MSRRLRSLPLPVALLGLGACGPSLADARATWERNRPDSYVFEYQGNCICPSSGEWWRVTVRHDSVVDVQLLEAAAAGSNPGFSFGKTLHPTVSQMFDGIAEFASRPHTWTKVRFDRHWRFPSQASGDATDRLRSQWSFTVRNFQPIQ